MDEIISICQQINPVKEYSDDKREFWRFWLSEERGTYTAFIKKHRECKDDYTKKTFYERFPDKMCWFELCVLYNPKYVKYLTLNNLRMSVEKDRIDEKDPYPCNMTEVLGWVKGALLSMIEELRAGRYNERLENELPYSLRYGVISRKTYWGLIPEEKKHVLGGLTQDDIKEFIERIESEGEDYIPKKRIKGMTFNKYFEYAYYAYQTADYDVARVTSAQAFIAYGEDFGGGVFRDIDFDSTEDFDGYYENQLGYAGGHPWGIRRGSSRTRIMFHPVYSVDGYYFWLGGNPNFMIFEIVRFYLGLKRNNVPVYLSNREAVLKYLKEEDLIGFVKETEMPIYCSNRFPNHDVQDFRHFDENRYPEMKRLIEWLPLKKIELKV